MGGGATGNVETVPLAKGGQKSSGTSTRLHPKSHPLFDAIAKGIVRYPCDSAQPGMLSPESFGNKRLAIGDVFHRIAIVQEVAGELRGTASIQWLPFLPQPLTGLFDTLRHIRNAKPIKE
jgi:hypothetical protein